MLIDIHVHLQDPAFAGQTQQIIDDLRSVGSAKWVCNGSTPADWGTVARLAETCPEVIPCFGVHPWYVHQAGEDWETKLREYLWLHPSAVGECGIDRWIEPRDEALQERIFRRHLQIAAELKRPIMVHCLRAWSWLMEILASAEELPERMLLHSYGGPVEMIEPLARYGAWFSFSGSIFEPKRQKLRDALLAVPKDRLLIETDAPAMLPPENLRTHHILDANGKMQNHPANLPVVYQGIARLLGCCSMALEPQIEQNAHGLLGDLL
jgi:TatD DNase family protein